MARSSMGKGAIIEKYLDKHPGANVADVVEALKRHGITAAYVHQIRHRRKIRGLVEKPAAKKRQSAAPAAAAAIMAAPANGHRAAASSATTTVDLQGVVAAYRFIVACGGIDQAHAAIDGAAQLMSEMGLKS